MLLTFPFYIYINKRKNSNEYLLILIYNIYVNKVVYENPYF